MYKRDPHWKEVGFKSLEEYLEYEKNKDIPEIKTVEEVKKKKGGKK